jgi:hypothetical protein
MGSDYAKGVAVRGALEAMRSWAPDLPLVGLPHDPPVMTRPGIHSVAAEESCSVLEAVADLLGVTRASAIRGPDLALATEKAADAATKLLDKLSATLAHDAPQLLRLEPATYDAYLGVRRPPFSEEQSGAQIVGIVQRALVDLQYAPIGVHDAVHELAGIVALLRDLTLSSVEPRSASGVPSEGRIAPSPATRFVPTGDGLQRWLIGHHLYAVFNLYAAARLREAVPAIDHGDGEKAARFIDAGVVYVLGFTGAMSHAAAVSADIYASVIRPTMHPPKFPVSLSGTMNPDHANYRAALGALLSARSQSFQVLIRECPALALARDALLEADLLDLECHIRIAASLVGDGVALTQDERAPQNAVTTLRCMRTERARSYGVLTRYGSLGGTKS